MRSREANTASDKWVPKAPPLGIPGATGNSQVGRAGTQAEVLGTPPCRCDARVSLNHGLLSWLPLPSPVSYLPGTRTSFVILQGRGAK